MFPSFKSKSITTTQLKLQLWQGEGSWVRAEKQQRKVMGGGILGVVYVDLVNSVAFLSFTLSITN